jgi:quercetin dioxygenase-like cupin family protein
MATLHRWQDLPVDRPMDKISRRRVIGEKAMLSEVTLQKGFVVPTHKHENEQFACILKGKLRFTINEGAQDQRTVDAPEGTVLHLPGNVPHAAEALEDSVVLDVFSPPSEKTGVDRR